MKTRQRTAYFLCSINQKINRGFTLTELLIAITITGIMPAVLMPWVVNYINLPERQIIANK